ncbi:MAG TPA: thiol reductant ABC exporter subunit CydD [Ktedonobacteraceae bacterium]|nr:thiol reductant ABC exporter subunit CydD [Ktedonobacteraceae bacterium]
MNKALFRYSKFAQVAIVLTTLLGMLVVGATIVQMVFLSKVVNGIFLAHKTLAGVEPFLLLLLAFIAVRAVFVWLREVTAQQGSIHVKSALRQQLFAHLFALGPGYHKGESTGELVATASEGVERLDAYVSRYLPQVALSVLVPIVILVYIFPLDWISAALLLVTGPIIPLLMIIIGSYAEKVVQSQWLALSRMSASFLDAIQGLPTLKLFGRSSAAGAKVERMSNAFGEKTLKMLRVAFLSGAVLEFMTAAAIGVVAVTLGVRLINNDISFESAFLVLLLTPEFYKPLRELGVSRHAGMEGKVAAKRLLEILETPLPVPAPAISTSHKRPVNPLTIRFANVTCTYPGNKETALTKINLTLPAGTRTALVGRSGAGKSTLVNLLLRFMDTQSGNITVNDIPLSELPVEVWRESIALVPQRPYLFNDTILANIRMARPTASEDDIKEAATLAGAEEFIQQLPQGYNTQIGERGARLSAGQAQRIAIARAFLKDAPLLILDEPTSSLDPKSELLIRQALAHLMQQRTVLVIAHRYNTIANVEQIAVLDNGQIVAVKEQGKRLHQHGSHQQLMDMYRKAGVAI